ncbi:hypothetical protein RhiirA4_486033 [Rhizophagus irregularis]|uniref:Uncharacterized protein n=1 Tax=Rhizophagus irregularis TaxID=588596 RepID=A0A2I1HQV7_9GLOM|nr:hypothetical protein RhiirA4_486033 [Rhizophagus irregularis]
MNNFISSLFSSLFLSLYYINPSFTIALPYTLDESVKDYFFYPQWAVNFNSATQTLSVGHVYITYRKKDSAIMSHWLPVSTSADEQSFNPCPDCSFNVPTFSQKSAIKLRCNSKKCFFQVSLSETTDYPTRNAKVFAAYLPISLSTTWSYATSLAFIHLDSSLYRSKDVKSVINQSSIRLVTEDNQWSIYGQSMVNLWSINGQLMVNQWSIYGQSMVNLWSING